MAANATIKPKAFKTRAIFPVSSSENLLREGRSHRCEERWCLEADAFQDGRLAGAEAGEHAKRGPDGTPDGGRGA